MAPSVFVDGLLLKLVAGQESFGAPAKELYYDISAFSGQTVSLEFNAHASFGNYQTVYMDSIGFSSAIPEPGTTTLIVFGLVLLSGRYLWPCARVRVLRLRDGGAWN